MVLGAPPLAERGMAESWRDVNWLPYHRFEIETRLTRQEALDALAAHVEPENWFRVGWPNSKNDKRFEGTITPEGFRVRRVIGYRNSFLPVISGDVQAVGGMSKVIITMRPFVFVIAFCALWCAIALSTLTSGAPALVGIAMLAFLYLMVMGGFWFEASKQEQTLREIFAGG